MKLRVILSSQITLILPYLNNDPINTLLSFCLENCTEREAAYVFSVLRLALVQKSTPHLLNFTATSSLSSHPFILMQMCNITLFFFNFSISLYTNCINLQFQR